MFIVLVVVLILALIGFIGSLLLRGPLIRTTEERHGLGSARDAITEARKLRLEEHSKSTELDGKVKEQRKKLAEIESELRKAQQQVNILPKQVFEVAFELGAPDPGLQPYEFIVSRSKRQQRPSELHGPEAALWARPRLLRAWSRNQTGAMAMAQTRFSSMDGFILRVAERSDRPTLAAESRG
jgi:hypothetical protein